MKNQKKSSDILAAIKMGELTLLDAMIFQEVIARNNKNIPTLANSIAKTPSKTSFADAWEQILVIDYQPIFDIAYKLINAIPSSPNVEEALKILANEAQRIASSRALLRHDLMGRIYHLLLMRDIAKYQATYYTSVPSAYILARFALNAPNDNWSTDWADTSSIANFRAADLACGSGTLLSAAYTAILDKHVTEAARQDADASPQELHQVLLEHVFTGFDVLGFAAHLTAVTLALHNPTALFSTTGIYALPLTGKGDKPRLGSIDLLQGKDLIPSISLTGEIITPEKKGIAVTEQTHVSVSEQDLIIMNPPFTRSVVGNLLFGAKPESERKILQPHLQKILKNNNMSGIGQAGLGAVFFLVADRQLRQGGRLAFVIPRSLMSGVSWRKIRELLSDNYVVELLVTSHQPPNNWNFSENTDLSEILVVARKRTDTEEEAISRAIIANLWRKPTNEMESIIIAEKLVELNKTLLSHTRAYDLLESGNAASYQLMLGEKQIGEAYAITAELLSDHADNWGQLAPFAQGALNKLAYRFTTTGKLTLFGLSLPLRPFKEMANMIGPDISQVRQTFSVSKVATTYRALWNHESEKMQTISAVTNAYLTPTPGKANLAQKLWDNGSGHVMVANRLWLKTHRVAAVYLDKPGLGSMWWPATMKNFTKITTDELNKIEVLWLNSTFGLLGILSLRQDTRGAFIQTKKEALEAVPILNAESLTKKQIGELLDLYFALSTKEIPAFPIQFEEAAKKQGWRYELDKRLVEIIVGETKDLTPLYEMLAREPIICLKPLA